MIRYNMFYVFFLCAVLFCLSPMVLAQGMKPQKITNIPGGFFVEWDSPVKVAAVNLGSGLTGTFEVMFDVPSVEFLNTSIDGRQSRVTNPALMSVLADYWNIRGKPEQAMALYKEALKQEDIDENLSRIFQNNLAMLYSQVLDDHARAMEIVDKALERWKDNVVLLDTKGLIYLNSGDPESAIPPLERAVELSCQHPLYCMHLSSALYQSGQMSQARQYLERVRDQLTLIAPKMTDSNKLMFDDLQRTFPPAGQ